MYLPMSQFLEAPCNSKTQTTMSKTHSLPNIIFFACNKVVVTNACIAYTFIYGYTNFDRVFFYVVELILQYVLYVLHMSMKWNESTSTRRYYQ